MWLIGDFNGSDRIRGESYDAVTNCGWLDTWLLAKNRDEGITVPNEIDGWEQGARGQRLDYIWCSRSVGIRSSRVMFSGGPEPVVSDHFGVLIETEPLS